MESLHAPLAPAPCPSRAPLGQPAAAASTTPRRGLEISLNAGGGYLYYRQLALDAFEFSGPVVNASLELTWLSGFDRVGLRLHGFFSPGVDGTINPFLEGPEGSGEARMWGAYLSAIGRLHGLYASLGVGVLGIMDIRYGQELPAGTPHIEPGEHYEDLQALPEGVLALGYDLWPTDWLGLRVGGEVGTFCYLTWRLQASASAVIRF